MANKKLVIENSPEIRPDSSFVKHIQGQILLLFKQRGNLTETQYKSALRLLGEKRS